VTVIDAEFEIVEVESRSRVLPFKFTNIDVPDLELNKEEELRDAQRAIGEKMPKRIVLPPPLLIRPHYHIERTPSVYIPEALVFRGCYFDTEKVLRFGASTVDEWMIDQVDRKLSMTSRIGFVVYEELMPLQGSLRAAKQLIQEQVDVEFARALDGVRS
jgi:hypothetical protein